MYVCIMLLLIIYCKLLHFDIFIVKIKIMYIHVFLNYFCLKKSVSFVYNYTVSAILLVISFANIIAEVKIELLFTSIDEIK
jgi:hypothetical protein